MAHFEAGPPALEPQALLAPDRLAAGHAHRQAEEPGRHERAAVGHGSVRQGLDLVEERQPLAGGLPRGGPGEKGRARRREPAGLGEGGPALREVLGEHEPALLQPIPAVLPVAKEVGPGPVPLHTDAPGPGTLAHHEDVALPLGLRPRVDSLRLLLPGEALPVHEVVAGTQVVVQGGGQHQRGAERHGVGVRPPGGTAGRPGAGRRARPRRGRSGRPSSSRGSARTASARPSYSPPSPRARRGAPRLRTKGSGVRTRVGPAFTTSTRAWRAFATSPAARAARASAYWISTASRVDGDRLRRGEGGRLRERAGRAASWSPRARASSPSRCRRLGSASVGGIVASHASTSAALFSASAARPSRVRQTARIACASASSFGSLTFSRSTRSASASASRSRPSSTSSRARKSRAPTRSSAPRPVLAPSATSLRASATSPR